MGTREDEKDRKGRCRVQSNVERTLTCGINGEEKRERDKR